VVKSLCYNINKPKEVKIGYTNYWRTKRIPKNELPQEFLTEVENSLDKIISQGIQLADGSGEKLYKNGKQIVDKAMKANPDYFILSLNGYGEDCYESFVFDTSGDHNFCKTARCNYDIAVKCILILAEKYQLLSINGEGSYWSFDGKRSDEEYQAAAKLLK